VICTFLTIAALVPAVFRADVGVQEAVLVWGDGVWIPLSLAMQYAIAMALVSPHL
jgi:short subunit fatty acids transporter